MMRLYSVCSLVRHAAFLLLLLPSSLALAAQSATTVSAADTTQTAPSEAAARKAKIQRQLATLHLLERADAPRHELALRWALLGAEYANAGHLTEGETAYNRALHLVAADKTEDELHADILDQLGALYRIYGRNADALHCYQTAFTLRAPLMDPLEDARSRARLAEIALVTRDYKEAYAETDQAYRSMRHMSDPDSSEVISALIVRAYAQCGLHRCIQGRQDAVEALNLSRREFSETSMQVGAALAALGSTELANKDVTHAEEALHQAVDLLKGQLTAADPRLRYALEQYHKSLVSLHRKQKARQVQDELQAMDREPHPSCINCTVSAFSVRPSAPAKCSSAVHQAPAPTGGATAVSKPAESAPQRQ